MFKWHGNEEQMDTAVCYVLQPYGVHIVSYLKTEVIMKLILWPQHSYLDLRVSVFLFPKELTSMINVNIAGIREI